ncbi:class II aldolase/adducin family protein [Noviherbaspirillum sp. Root189]|uniref:class II aldolase/adducin family protein n=1 Tax=Noviherbaspirillum sp. Root189 TaxID=1736487 RepID=UPI000710F380|nr:class II aldolase/adducin family protein [Noviherbaspirillum sp. Root189]KRB70666.1 aldolase [Noviherbaspirillum sp. Root189]
MKQETLQNTEFSAAEWQARVELAACYRLVDHFDMCDMIYNHISLRVPGEGHAFLINPFGMMYSEITASSLLKVDIDGRILYNPWSEYSINKAGYVIHSALHAANERIACVVHTHTPDGMAVSALKCGLLPITQTAMRFGEVAYHDYEGVAVEEDERERLVQHMGNSEVMILRNHGLLAVGETVQQAFNNIYRLERACRTQVKAMSCGAELVIPPQEVITKTNNQLRLQPSADKPGSQKPYGILEWPALLRMLDRKDPSYKT